MKKNKYIELYLKSLTYTFDKPNIQKIRSDAYSFYDYLVRKYISDPPKLKKLTLNNMYPAMSVYHSLKRNGYTREEAFELIDKVKETQSLKNAKVTKKLLSVFSLYKLYPTIFKKVTLKSYSKDIGFDPEFIVSSKSQCKFNMNKCIFLKRCTKEGMKELTPAFCHTDDSFNSNLNKNIIWKRKSTLAFDAPYCDFDVSLKKKEK